MFSSYLKLGFEHILDPGGIDHVLFILVLTVPFYIKDWKKVILLATAFTIGHSITLALSSLNVIRANSQFIEIFIAVSILITGVLNLLEIKAIKPFRYKYSLTLLFGLIHGLGFSNFFKSILGKDEIALPLLAFNIGVELAQIVVIIITLVATFFIVTVLKLKRPYWISMVSFFVIVLSFKMILERL